MELPFHTHDFVMGYRISLFAIPCSLFAIRYSLFSILYSLFPIFHFSVCRGRTSDMYFTKVFGCHCYLLRPTHRVFRGDFKGYAAGRSGLAEAQEGAGGQFSCSHCSDLLGSSGLERYTGIYERSPVSSGSEDLLWEWKCPREQQFHGSTPARLAEQHSVTTQVRCSGNSTILLNGTFFGHWIQPSVVV